MTKCDKRQQAINRIQDGEEERVARMMMSRGSGGRD